MTNKVRKEEVKEVGTVEEPQPLAVIPTPEPQAVNLFNAPDPAMVLARASDLAKALAGVILQQQLYTEIQGRKHVRVEGWTLCGSMLGVYPVCQWTRPIEGGWEARVEAVTMAGQTVGAAEAQCTRKERTWASRDDYALRSMAQTRAVSKALRLPLGFIIQLAGYAPTPAEEMPQYTTNPGGATITKQQAMDLDCLIAEVGANKAGFLRMFDVEHIEDLAAANYAPAMRMLEAKRK